MNKDTYYEELLGLNKPKTKSVLIEWGSSKYAMPWSDWLRALADYGSLHVDSQWLIKWINDHPEAIIK